MPPPVAPRPSPYAHGVPTPYAVHVHPYPTRYHGGIWTRPVFGLPYVRSPQAVFKPGDFMPPLPLSGLRIGDNELSAFAIGAVAGAAVTWLIMRRR